MAQVEVYLDDDDWIYFQKVLKDLGSCKDQESYQKIHDDFFADMVDKYPVLKFRKLCVDITNKMIYSWEIPADIQKRH